MEQDPDDLGAAWGRAEKGETIDTMVRRVGPKYTYKLAKGSQRPNMVEAGD